MLTDRDIVWLIAEGCDPATTTVGQFVRAPVQTASVSDGIGDVVKKMHEKSVRRLPVCDDDGKLIGMVSLDDVVVLLGTELADAAGTITGELDRERAIGAERSTGGTLAAS